MVPAARLREIRPLGETGKHSRFELESGAGKASGVAFGMNGDLERQRRGRRPGHVGPSRGRPLERRRGTARGPARALPAARRDRGRPAAGDATRTCAGESCTAPEGEWWERFDAAYESFDDAWPVAPAGEPARSARSWTAAAAPPSRRSPSWSPRATRSWPSSPTRAAAGRWPASAADPRRFGAGEPLIACCRCGEAALDAALGTGADAEHPAAWSSRTGARSPRSPSAAPRLQHVVLVDPPPFERLDDLVRAGPGFLHLAWSGAEVELAELCAGGDWAAPRGDRRALARAAPAGSLEGEDLRAALAGARATHARPRSPRAACASSASSGSPSGPRIAPPRASGSYPRRGPSWSGRGPSRPQPPGTRRQGDTCEAEHRAEGRAHRVGEPGGARTRPPQPDAITKSSPTTSARCSATFRGDRGALVRAGRADRPRRGRASVRVRLREPRGPGAQVRRGLHHPPARRRPHLRRDAPRHRDAERGAAARHRRGHVGVDRRGPRALRRGDRPARRRRHEADRDHLQEPRRAPGRELPEDDGGDGHRRQGHPDQAGRPPSQHAHARRRCRSRSSRRRRARRSRSSPRWPTGSASTRSSGSSRTSRSRPCTRASTTRSRTWSPSSGPSARTTSTRRGSS